MASVNWRGCCSVCQEGFKGTDFKRNHRSWKILTLKECGHKYHGQCIQNVWVLENDAKCPLCYRKLDEYHQTQDMSSVGSKELLKLGPSFPFPVRYAELLDQTLFPSVFDLNIDTGMYEEGGFNWYQERKVAPVRDEVVDDWSELFYKPRFGNEELRNREWVSFRGDAVK